MPRKNSKTFVTLILGKTCRNTKSSPQEGAETTQNRGNSSFGRFSDKRPLREGQTLISFSQTVPVAFELHISATHSLVPVIEGGFQNIQLNVSGSYQYQYRLATLLMKKSH